MLADVDVNAPLIKPLVGNIDEDYTKRSKNRFESEYIWNTNWQKQAEIRDKNAADESKKSSTPKAESGFLSFNRVADLNDMSVDLSQELLRSKPKPSSPRSAASHVPMVPVSKSKGGQNLPTASEVRAWSRSGSYQRRGSSSSSTAEQQEAGPNAAQAAAEQWGQTKQEYQLWTAVASAVCFGITYTVYTKDIAASYLIGALGGYMYLRLLGRTVDGVGAESMGAAASGAASQPRLLIPVILALLYNRYNTLYSDKIGITLELLPILAGFFTYKLAVLGRNSISLYNEMKSSPQEDN